MQKSAVTIIESFIVGEILLQEQQLRTRLIVIFLRRKFLTKSNSNNYTFHFHWSWPVRFPFFIAFRRFFMILLPDVSQEYAELSRVWGRVQRERGHCVQNPKSTWKWQFSGKINVELVYTKRWMCKSWNKGTGKLKVHYYIWEWHLKSIANNLNEFCKTKRLLCFRGHLLYFWWNLIILSPN